MVRGSTVKVPFGILNLKGLMQHDADNVIQQPIFAHEAYEITTTLDPTYQEDFGILSFKEENPLEGKSYQKLYRKSVRWNFGDGTEIDGYSATHHYDIPGKYTITCTFFDVHRQGILNEYKLQVIVKQVIPSVISFDTKESSKESIKCSEITKIARLEVLLSNNVKDNVDILPKLEKHNQLKSFAVRDTGDYAENLIQYFHIEHPIVGKVKSITIRCRSTRANYLDVGPFYLGIWEQDKRGNLVKIGVSLNQEKQEYGKLITWNFDGVKLSGRPIKIALTRNAEEAWQAGQAPRMGPCLVDSSSENYSEGSPLPYVQHYSGKLPVMSIIAFDTEETEGKNVPDWNSVKDYNFPHLRSYQTFLEKTTEYYYNSEEVYKEIFTPVDKYVPEYEDLYGYFTVEGEDIVFKCYRIQPYASKAALPPIQINDPNKSILEEESFTTYPVLDVSTEEELPEEAKYAGKRAFVDVYYKSDFLSEKDVIFFSFDIDNINVHNSIEASTNFLNIPPLGLHLSVIENDFTDVNYSVTLNGFLSSYEPVDKLVQLSLAKDYEFNTLLIPYFLSECNSYYIPKDFDFSQYVLNTRTLEGNDSTISLGGVVVPFIRTVNIKGKSQLTANLTISQGATTHTISFNYPVKDLSEVVIPTEKYYNQDVKKLIDVYTPHEMFQHTPLLKQTLVDLFENKRMLDYVVTKSVNFFDDNVNHKTNYVTCLLNTLSMMGRDAFEYDQTTFEGVNELRDLCRVLSMNHSELVGNLIDESYDIRYSENYKGKHIGDEVLVTDELYVLPENEPEGEKRHQKGKIAKIIRDGKTLVLREPTILVTRDLYTNETKTVSFSDITPDKQVKGYNIYYLKSYKSSWGWGLLLPDKVDAEGKVLQSYYGFYLLMSPEHIVRVGNFLQENTITSETETKATWEEADGKTFDKLQKVIYSALDVV